MYEDKISIIVPVYNEQYSIQQTLREIKENIKKTSLEYEIVAINDGSKDKSKEILEKIGGIRLLNHEYNRGYGVALKTGIKNARYDLILIIDADGTYPIKDIPKLIGSMKFYDMVVGARINMKNVPVLRRIAKFIITKLANFLSKRKIPDINSGFRIFKKDLALKFFNLFPEGFSFTTTLTLAFLINNHDIRYIPINYFRRRGKSKIRLNDFFGFIQLIFRIMTYFNPLRMFSLLSFVVFVIGVVIFLYSLILLDKILDITVTIFLLTALQIFILGLIADLIIKSK